MLCFELQKCVALPNASDILIAGSSPNSVQLTTMHQTFIRYHQHIGLGEQRKSGIILPMDRLYSDGKRGEMTLSEHGVAGCLEHILRCRFLLCTLLELSVAAQVSASS
jgi:hypothetical protein